jgi:DNA polymerase-3 subunit alpha
MATLFADLPEAWKTRSRSRGAAPSGARKRDPILPRFAEDEVEELRRQAKAGLKARLAVIPACRPGRRL